MAEVLGGFEHTVLLAIMRLDSSAYSVPIVLELEKRTGRSVAPAAVYVTLRRLEKKGLLTSSMIPAEEGQGGRDRRVLPRHWRRRRRTIPHPQIVSTDVQIFLAGLPQAHGSEKTMVFARRSWIPCAQCRRRGHF